MRIDIDIDIDKNIIFILFDLFFMINYHKIYFNFKTYLLNLFVIKNGKNKHK